MVCSERLAEAAAQPDLVQKQLRAHLVELRALVPSAAAALLVQPLLQSSTLQPPQLLPPSDKPPSASQQGRGSQNCAGASPSHQAAQLLRQWQAAMALLQQEWPALPALCLASAMDSLLQGLPLASHHFAWAVALLRSVALSGQQVRCCAGVQASSETLYDPADFSWEATSQQLSKLLRDCLFSSSASQFTSGSGRTVSAGDAVVHLSSEGERPLNRNHVLDVMLLLCTVLGEEATAAARASISVPARMVRMPLTTIHTATMHTTSAVTGTRLRHAHWSIHEFIRLAQYVDQ